MTTEIKRIYSSRADGDFSILGDPVELERRRRRLVDLEWTWLHQTHGTSVAIVGEPGDGAGQHADASVTSAVGAVLAVQTADCAPLLLWGQDDSGMAVIGAVHAGWRGLYDGILERTVAEMRALGATSSIFSELGPCISPEAYEFQPADLTTMALRFGPEVVAVTTEDLPAFDLRRAVRSECDRLGIDLRGHLPGGGVELPGGGVECTARASDNGSSRYFSHRARGDSGRQVSVIWIEDESMSPTGEQ